MHLFRETLLLFALNLLDALLTLVWVRSGVAGEANLLMAKLLEVGDHAFIGAKIGVGIIAAVVFLMWGDRQIARYGITLAILVYTGVMIIHLFTGVYAAGFYFETMAFGLESIADHARSILA